MTERGPRTWSRRTLLAIAGAGTVVAATGAISAADALPPVLHPRTRPGVNGARAGRSIGVAVGGFYDTAGVERFAATTGTRPMYCLPLFSDVADGLSGARLAAVNAAGFVPQVTWQPVRATVQAIAAGDWDQVIRTSARYTRGMSVQIRFGHEMNGTWNPVSRSPAAFVVAWQRMHGIFAAEGSGATWVWTPNVSDTNVLPFDQFYPGDSQCDLVGLDGYSNRLNGFCPFTKLFAADFARLHRLSSRPSIIGETAVQRGYRHRAAWVTEMFGWLQANPLVTGVTWWNRDQYVISPATATARAFRAGVAGWSTTAASR